MPSEIDRHNLELNHHDPEVDLAATDSAIVRAEGGMPLVEQDLPFGEEDVSLGEEEAPPKFRSPRKMGLAILGVLLLGGLGWYAANHLPQPSTTKSELGGKFNKKGQISTVTVEVATQKTVPVQLQAIGQVQPASTVSVTPQASGRVTGVYFQKGQDLKKGQLLFTIDDRSQIAAVQQAQGVIAKDQAQIDQARANLAKDQGAVEQAKATLAKDQAQVQQARANLAKDQGAVQQARATLTKDLSQVQQAKANLAKDTAQFQFAQAQSQRYTSLQKQGAVSLDQAQQYIANGRASTATLQADREAIANAQAVVQGDRVAIQNAETVVQGDLAAIQSAQAVVKGDLVAIQNAQEVVKGDLAAIKNAEAVKRSDEAALANVQVQSSYAKIYAPIDGRAGNILVTQGNVVQSNSNSPLVTIAKTHPIQVAFSIPETNLPEVRKYMSNGKLNVNVAFAENKASTIPGVLTFINNTVDNTTGTIQLIGDFDNNDGRLFPGQFVNTTLTLTTEPNATVIPAQAVQNGPNGQFVFVAQEDLTVKNVPVQVSSTIEGLAVIREGIKPGEQVVTDGQANLVSGSKIRIKRAGNSPDRGNSDPTSNGDNSDRPRKQRSGKGGGDS